MRNTLISIFGSFILIFNFNAQSVFTKGYVINNNNDTIRGWIEENNNSSNTSKCIFKLQPEAEKQIYKPADLQSFKLLNGKYFVSRLVTANGQSKQLFLEYLVQGLVNIFLYADEIGLHYLVDKGDGNLLELKNSTYLSEQDGKSYLREKREYVGILSYVFQDSPKTCAEAATKDLDYKSLIKLAIDYHNDLCASDKCIVYAKKPDVIKVHFGLLAGVNYTSLTKGKADDSEIFFQNTQFNSLVYPSLGVFAEVKFPYVNNDRLFARYEASFWQEKHTATNEYLISSTYSKNILTDSKFNFLNSLQVKLDLNRAKVRYFIEGGVFLKVALTTDFNRTLITRHDFSENQYTTTYNGPSEFHNLEVGPILGFGVRTKITKKREASLDLKYSRGYGTVSDQHFESNRISLNLGIQLF
jgi:hypothetical protein